MLMKFILLQIIEKQKPFLLVCNTTKGKGVSFMENKPIWHYRSPTPEEYKIVL